MKTFQWRALLFLFLVVLPIIAVTTVVGSAQSTRDAPDSVTISLSAAAQSGHNQAANKNSSTPMPGFALAGMAGQPLLPAKTIHVALPPGADLNSVQLEIISQTNELLPGLHDIPPAPPLVAWVDGQRIEDWGEAAPYITGGKDSRIYENDAFFPEQPVTLVEVGKMRKWRIAKITYVAQRYNPQSKRLQSVDSVQIRFNFNSSKQPDSRLDEELSDTAFDTRARDLIFNFAQAQNWYALPSQEQTARNAAASAPPGYAIITTRKIANRSKELSSFIAHKESEGFNVSLVTEDEYGALTGPSPNETAEKIRKWLQDNYLEKNIVYTLLIGNPDPVDPQRENDSAGDVPMKMCWPRRGGYVSFDNNVISPEHKRGDIVQFLEYGDLLPKPQFDARDFALNINVNAFHITSDLAQPECNRERLLLSVKSVTSFPGIGQVTPNDIVMFEPGWCDNYHHGTFSMYLRGEDVGLALWREHIDAISMSPEGNLVISTKGKHDVPGSDGNLSGFDEDLLVFDPASRTWETYFQGASIPGLATEDIDGAWIDPTLGDLYLSLEDEFNVGGTEGDGSTILRIHADQSTSVKWQLQNGNNNVNGLQLGGLHDHGVDSPTDYYFADMDGSWDADGDGYFCEYSHDRGAIDFYADIYIGRIPVYYKYSNWVVRLDRVLAKSVSYELESDTSWRRSAFLPMAFLDTGSDGAYLAQNMIDDFLGPRDFSTYTMFQHESDTPCNSVLQSDADLIDGNTAQHWANNPSGLMTWVGHGYGQGTILYWNPCHGGDLFVSADTPQLDDDHPAFTFHHSCSNGLVEVRDNVASELLYRGAIGTTAASRVSWGFVSTYWTPSPYGADDGSLAFNYMKLLSSNTPAAEALYGIKGNTSGIDGGGPLMMNVTGFNLLGDPSLNLDLAVIDTNNIAGTVSAEADGSSLADITVHVYRYDEEDEYWEWVAGDYTDRKGSYNVSGLNPGVYRVGFFDYSGDYADQYFDGAPDLASAADVTVISGQTTSNIDALLRPTGNIAGTVSAEADGSPLADISVDVYRYNEADKYWQWVDGRYTDRKGSYRISGLNPGVYRVGFIDFSRDYADQYFDGAPDLASAADVTVISGQTTSNIDTLLQPTGKIAGTVSAEADGSPLADISVDVYRYNEADKYWQWVVGDYTDRKGYYIVSGLNPGVYRVGFFDYSGDYADQYFDGAPDLASAADVTVISGQTTSNIDALLQPTGKIAGTVSAEADGSPLADISVDVYRYNEADKYWERVDGDYTDGKGNYLISSLNPGNYRVHFADPSNNYAPEYFEGILDIAKAQDVPVRSDETAAGIDASLEYPVAPENDSFATPLIIGTVPYRHSQVTSLASSESDDPYLPCAEVQGFNSVWYQLTPQVDGPVTISTNGSDYDTVLALWHGDRPNLVSVACKDDGYGSSTQSLLNDINLSAGKTYFVEVASYGEVGGLLTLSLSATPGKITGTVTAESDGSDLKDISVDVLQFNSLRDAWDLAGSVKTDETGHYSMSPLYPGIYRVRFYDESEHFVEEYSDDAPNLAEADDVIVVAGQETASIDAALASNEFVIFAPVVQSQQ